MKLPGRQRKGLLIQRESSSRQKERLDSQQWNDHKYDESTGQVYTEKTASILSAVDRDWTRRTRLVFGRNEQDELKQAEAARAWENRRLGRSGGHQSSVLVTRKIGGARSLQSIALESVIQNIADVTADSFEYLPITLVKRIWDIVRKRCFVSFDTWALFSRILHSEDYISEDLLQYAEAFSEPKLQFEMYITPLISDSFDFITSLCITTPFPVPDLMRISSIRNLGVLEIINTDASSAGYAQMGVSDRILRGWHLAATEEGAFPVLRILRLWNHEDLTSQSLVFLNGFPSLAVFDVRGCRFNAKEKTQARDLGWRLSTETDILKLLERTCIKRAETLQTQLPATPASITGYSRPNYSDQADIKRIPRNELMAFLANRPSSAEPDSGILKLKPHPVYPRRSQNKLERVTYVNVEYASQKHQKLDAWESSAYKTHARIGELRNETDIERAGKSVGDAVTLGHELLNPLPMVLLRLGKSPSSLMLATRTSINAVSFIRIKAPSAEEIQTKSPVVILTQEEISQKLVHRPQPPAQASSTGKTQPSVQKHKKRSLDDMLSSFM